MVYRTGTPRTTAVHKLWRTAFRHKNALLERNIAYVAYYFAEKLWSVANVLHSNVPPQQIFALIRTNTRIDGKGTDLCLISKDK